jgi:hypothetical protein
MTIHYFKAHPNPFEAVAIGAKTHEVRRDDRRERPRPGDLVVLREWDPHGPACGCRDCRGPEGERIGPGGNYTGSELRCRVTHVTLPGTWGLPTDVYVMSVRVER